MNLFRDLQKIKKEKSQKESAIAQLRKRSKDKYNDEDASFGIIEMKQKL